jgi:hypothetical protein
MDEKRIASAVHPTDSVAFLKITAAREAAGAQVIDVHVEPRRLVTLKGCRSDASFAKEFPNGPRA